ncbi:MAG: radical SAM protein [Acidobacteriota bacterium]
MNNIFLTNLCNNHCPYCFARGKLKRSHQECVDGDFLSMADARLVAEFFEESKLISFLGGEPTLHPQFREITDIFVEKGYQIFLFTNGLFDRSIREFLSGQQQLFYVFNINDPALYREDQWRMILDNLGALREKVNSLALAIYDVEQDCSHVARLAIEYGIKAVKIAVAAPSHDDGNRRIPFEEKHRVAGRLAEFVERLSEAGILAYGECEKLKPCMFDDRSRERILASKWIGNLYVNKQCREGGNIDIGPDLTVWRCYSFPKSMGKRLTDFRSPEEIRDYSRQKYDLLFFNYYWLDRCFDCDYSMDQRCEGGCLLRILRKYEEREAYFYDHHYAEQLERAGDARLASLYENPSRIELANIEGRAPRLTVENARADGAEIVLTPFLHHFSPFDVTLFTVHGEARFFPSRIKVCAGPVRVALEPGGTGWRRTRCVTEADFLSEPWPIYETDFREITWLHPEITLPDPSAVAIYYTAIAEDGREIFCSLSPQGFSWLGWTSGSECLNVRDLVRSRRETL